jgi:hypothetical protein
MHTKGTDNSGCVGMDRDGRRSPLRGGGDSAGVLRQPALEAW